MRSLSVSYIKWTGRFFMGKRRRKRAGFWLKGICLILLVPVFITTLMQRMRLENLIYGKEG